MLRKATASRSGRRHELARGDVRAEVVGTALEFQHLHAVEPVFHRAVRPRHDARVLPHIDLGCDADIRLERRTRVDVVQRGNGAIAVDAELGVGMTFVVEDRGLLRLHVVMHTAATPLADDWRAYEAALREAKGPQGIYVDRMRVLVISDGGAPDTHQRHLIQNDIWEGKPVKTALLTNSLKNPVKRGIARALTWMNPGFLVCAPHDLPAAVRHLEMAHDFDHIWAQCVALQGKLPPIQTLELIARGLGVEAPPGKPVSHKRLTA